MGFFGQLLSGKDSKADLADAKRKGDAALEEGFDTGMGKLDEAGHKLDAFSSPNALKRLLDALGVNGPEAQAAVEGEYMNDPIQKQMMDRIASANTRRFTSMMPGSQGNNSGAATQSLTNSLLDNWRKYQEQLQTPAGMSQDAAKTQAGFLKDEGDMAYGHGATKAGNEINYGKERAGLESTGINNIIKLMGAGSEAAKAGAKVATAMG